MLPRAQRGRNVALYMAYNYIILFRSRWRERVPFKRTPQNTIQLKYVSHIWDPTYRESDTWNIYRIFGTPTYTQFDEDSENTWGAHMETSGNEIQIIPT